MAEDEKQSPRRDTEERKEGTSKSAERDIGYGGKGEAREKKDREEKDRKDRK